MKLSKEYSNTKWKTKRFNYEPIIYIFAENDEDVSKAVDEDT